MQALQSCRFPALAFATLIWTASLPGCGCEDERPYTPFQVATALPNSSPTAPTPEAQTPKTTLPRLVQKAGDLAETWEVFGATLTAPAGTGFVTAMELPAGNAPRRVAAWALPMQRKGLGGEAGLWLFDEGGRTLRRLARIPTWVPSGADCKHSIEMLDSGGASFTSTVLSQCSTRMLPGTPTGALVITDPDAESAERISFRLSEPAPGEALTLDARTHDEDGDGFDDLALKVTLTAPSGAQENVTIRWVGRASGLSHVAGTPVEELRARAGRLAIAAVRKKERQDAVEHIDTLRRLLFAVCSESKTEKFSDGSGVGLSCGAVASAAHVLTGAAIDAFLGLKMPQRALGELERGGYYFAAPSERTAASWVRKLQTALPTADATLVDRARIPLGLNIPYPFASPLRFDQAGNLFSLSAGRRPERLFPKVPEPETVSPAPPPPAALPAADVAIDGQSAGLGPDPNQPPAGQASLPEGESPPQLAPWPLRPRSQTGEMLTAAIPSCDRSEVQLALAGPEGNALPSRPLHFLAPRPGGCRSLTSHPLDATVVGWDGDRLLAVVGGEPVVTAGHLEQSPEPIVWPTQAGLAVWRGAQLTLLVGAESTGAHHCVAGPTDGLVACVRGKDAVILRPQQSSAP